MGGTPGGLEVLPVTLISFPAVMALAPGAKGTFICWDVVARLTVWKGLAEPGVGKTVIFDVAGIRIVVVATPGLIGF